MQLLSNERLNARLKLLAHGPIEFFSIEIPEQNEATQENDIFRLPAWVIYPPRFDSTKQMHYPLLVYLLCSMFFLTTVQLSLKLCTVRTNDYG